MINDITVTENLNELSESQLMELTGQGAGPSTNNNEGLARLNINYTEEDDEGKTLPRGDWKIMSDGRFVYAPTIKMRPFLRTYTYSIWDDEESKFSSQSIQAKSLGERFIDTDGTEKCGRLSKQDEAKLPETDPRVLLSRSVVCNQVIYGMISGSFVKGNKEKIEVKNHPVISYFKRSGFVPISSFIQTLTRQKKIMQKCVIKIGTQRQKKGSVTYWIPVPSLSSETEINDTDKELMKKFAETVKAHNENIMNQYRDAVKLISPAKDDDLAGDFSAANA